MQDHEDDWRRLALQFDRHRMQAIAHLKAMLKDPVKHAALAAEFVNSPPLDPTLAVPSQVKGMLSTTCPFCENGFSFELGPMCGCGAKLAKDCDEEWGPTCDLGNNPAHVAVASLSTEDKAVLAAAPKLIGWRTENFLWETDDVDKARNWEPNIGVLPIFEGDPNTKLGSRGITAPAGGDVGVFREYFDAHMALLAAKQEHEDKSRTKVQGHRTPSQAQTFEPIEKTVHRNKILERRADKAYAAYKSAQERFNNATRAALAAHQATKEPK